MEVQHVHVGSGVEAEGADGAAHDDGIEIADALEKTNWSRKEAARMLGISYKALLYKMRQFKLDAGKAPRSSPAAPIARNG